MAFREYETEAGLKPWATFMVENGEKLKMMRTNRYWTGTIVLRRKTPGEDL